MRITNSDAKKSVQYILGCYGSLKLHIRGQHLKPSSKMRNSPFLHLLGFVYLNKGWCFARTGWNKALASWPQKCLPSWCVTEEISGKNGMKTRYGSSRVKNRGLTWGSLCTFAGASGCSVRSLEAVLFCFLGSAQCSLLAHLDSCPVDHSQFYSFLGSSFCPKGQGIEIGMLCLSNEDSWEIGYSILKVLPTLHLYVCTEVCVCVCVCTCLCVYVCIHPCGDPKVNGRYLSQPFSTLSLRHGLFIEPEFHQLIWNLDSALSVWSTPGVLLSVPHT